MTPVHTTGARLLVDCLLAHGVTTGGLFCLVGMLSDRRHTRLISEYGGIKEIVPRLTAGALILTLASIGLPGMNGFVGEFLIMLGGFKWEPRFVVVAGLGVILSAVYMLWMFQRVFYGEVTSDHNRRMPDLSLREWAIIGPLAAIAIYMGVFPNPFLKPMEPAVNRIVERVNDFQAMTAFVPEHPDEPRRNRLATAPYAPYAPYAPALQAP